MSEIGPTLRIEESLDSVYNEEDRLSRGVAVIIQNFKDTEKGVDKIKQQCKQVADVLEEMEFEIFENDAGESVLSNLSRKELHEVLEKVVTKNDIDDYYCLVVILLARGKYNEIICNDGTDYRSMEFSEVLKYFEQGKNQSLDDIPKLFILQTLGEDPDPNQADASGYMPDDKLDSGDTNEQTLPPNSIVYRSDIHVYLDKNVFLENIVTYMQRETDSWKEQKYFPKDVKEIQVMLTEMNNLLKGKPSFIYPPVVIHNLKKKMFLQRRQSRV